MMLVLALALTLSLTANTSTNNVRSGIPRPYLVRRSVDAEKVIYNLILRTQLNLT